MSVPLGSVETAFDIVITKLMSRMRAEGFSIREYSVPKCIIEQYYTNISLTLKTK